MKTEIAGEVQRRVSNQIFHYTRCIMLKRVTSLRGHLRIIAPGQHSFFQRIVAAMASLATLCPIWPAWDLSLWPPTLEMNELPLDQLAGFNNVFKPHNLTDWLEIIPSNCYFLALNTAIAVHCLRVWNVFLILLLLWRLITARHSNKKKTL